MGTAGDPTAQAYFQQIDDLLVNTDHTHNLKEITRHHWKPSEGRVSCFNRSCRKQFTMLERQHHCRKCGEVFCAKCASYLRRLNRLANFDPDGELHKVCQACFEKDKLLDGQTRSHTQEFKALRNFCKERMMPKYEASNLTAWRHRISFDQECQRLIKGFESSVGNSDIRRALHDMKSVVSTPDWMKSSLWTLENMCSNCQLCGEKVGWLSTKLFCRVCGVVVCSKCSTKDLLVYIPDEDRDADSCSARLAIIKVIGSPRVEPEYSLHMRICRNCQERLALQQVAQCSEEDDGEDQGKGDFLLELSRLHERFSRNEERVRAQLPKYIEVAESLVDNSRTSSSQSNMKTLAKAQEDLADVLAQHITIVQKLKQLRPRSQCQTSLLRTYIKAKCAFYLENMSAFRSTKHNLSELVPTESLDFIQRVMDKNAIISTHLYLRQLVYETIHLCSQYKLAEATPAFLMQLEAKVEQDVCNCLISEGDDVVEHMDIVKEMIRSRMKHNRLIRPSKKSSRVPQAMAIRTEAVLTQISLQLQLASAHRSFGLSKEALETALAQVKGEKETKKNLLKDAQESGFVVVDKNGVS